MNNVLELAIEGGLLTSEVSQQRRCEMRGVVVSVVLAVIVFSITSCSFLQGITGSSKDVVGTELYNPLPGTRVLNRQLAHSELVARSQHSGGVNALRLVQVYARGQVEGAPPRYRIFGVRRGSIYELLGLSTADVLLAAEGRVIYETDGFTAYVLSYLPNQSRASIDIMREGQPMRFEYEIIGSPQ